MKQFVFILSFFGFNLGLTAFSQSCQIIDSINTSPIGIYNPYFHPVGISYDGSGLWVAGSTLQENRIYKYNFSGIRVDSVDYDPNGQPIEAIQYDNGYLWAVKFMEDTLYKIEISTGNITQKHVIGMAPNYEETLDLAMRGDTIYFISGGASISRFKFVKSTGTILSMGSGDYSPTGIEFWNDILFATSWYPTWNQACLLESSTLLYNPSTPQPNWCVDKGLALTTDGTYFYETSWDTKNIYILSMDNLGVKNEKVDAQIPTISPNPCDGKFKLLGSETLSYFWIYNSQGMLIESGDLDANNSQLSIQISSGLYTLITESNGTLSVQKLSIVH
ncbi:MAG: hypothetical protein RI922_2233 [Bacteroidota bacterium]|jgi:tRNA-binding EMAP/Myf-like protein